MRVRDVGRVELGAESYSSVLRFAGFKASGIGIQLLPTANALETFKGVQETMERLEKNFPPGLEARLAFDNVVVVQESILEVLKTLGEAIVLVVLVLFLFLQNWRSTLIPALTIPVSLIGTFAFVKLFGFSINTLTLFGIVLATGTVVDDAIVVIENIERHMREYGKSALPCGRGRHARSLLSRHCHRHRAGGGVRACGVFPWHHRPDVSTVLADHRFCRGPVGLQRRHAHAGLVGAVARQAAAYARVVFPERESRFIDASTRFYVRAVRFTLNWRLAFMLFFAVTMYATWWVYRAVPGAFVPAEDEGYFITIVQAPAGSSLEYTTEVMKKAEQIYLNTPEILAVFSVAGFSFSGSAPNQGLMFARLKPFEERKEAHQSLEAVLGRLFGQVMAIPGGLVFPVAPPSIQGLSAFGGFQYELLDRPVATLRSWPR